MITRRIVVAAAALLWACCAGTLLRPILAEQPAEDLKPALGKLLFFDTNLSTPPGQGCVSCHDPKSGFADREADKPVSQGAIPERVGNRNAPTAAYAAFSPTFHRDSDGRCVGGQFWDGRSPDHVDQAKGPFMNPLEMNNLSKAAIIEKVQRAAYAGAFQRVFGPDSLKNPEKAFDQVAEAIAAYEASSDVCQFSSKYDHYLAKKATLTEQEARGLALFDGKARCAACHSSARGPGGRPPLFTDFTYHNIGVPKNPENPFYNLPKEFNPAGTTFVDRGIGGRLNDPKAFGKFKVPTLRNAAITGPYMHNGVFKTLGEAVEFHNSRDSGKWPPPEVPENVDKKDTGSLGLSDRDVEDLAAFLKTLTDGYTAPGAK